MGFKGILNLTKNKSVSNIDDAKSIGFYDATSEKQVKQLNHL